LPRFKISTGLLDILNSVTSVCYISCFSTSLSPSKNSYTLHLLVCPFHWALLSCVTETASLNNATITHAEVSVFSDVKFRAPGISITCTVSHERIDANYNIEIWNKEILSYITIYLDLHLALGKSMNTGTKSGIQSRN